MSRSHESVLTAIEELRRIESDRQAAEEAVRARQKQEAREAEAARAAAAEHAKKVIEAEARMRVDADLASRDADADRRMAALRVQLETIQREREDLHLRIAARVHEPLPEKRSRGWIYGFVASTALAGVLGALLLLKPTPVPTAVTEVSPADIAPVVVETLPESDPPAVTTPDVETPPATETQQTTPSIRRPPRPPRPPVSPTTMVEPDLDFDRCGDDPICGANATSMGSR